MAYSWEAESLSLKDMTKWSAGMTSPETGSTEQCNVQPRRHATKILLAKLIESLLGPPYNFTYAV